MKSIRNINILLITLMILFAIACTNSSEDKQYLKLKEEIEKGLDEEQRIRKLVYENMEKDTFDSQLNELMGNIDSLNLINVEYYLSKYGYPSWSKDGEKLCNGVFYILQHGDIETMEKYIEQLKEKAFTNEASKKHYALMKDRILTESNQKQIYGTQSVPRKNSKGFITNDYFIWPIKNVEIVDSLRNEMGFKQTVQEYVNEIQAEFNKSESIVK